MKKTIYFLAVVLIFLADRLAKILIQEKTRNYGAAFGILQGYKVLFIIVSFILIAVIIYYMRKAKTWLLVLSLALILAGTISNLMDRLFFGYVIDVINPGFIPSFNIADVSNTAGAVLLVAYILKGR